MKLNKVIKKFCCILLTTVLLFGFAEASYAATKTYSFSDLDIEIQIPTELAVFTRNVTSADKNLELIHASADQLRVKFQQYGIYLEAFPNDVTYELVVSGKTVSEELKAFNTLSETELSDGLQAYKEKCQSVETDELLGVSIYKNDTTSYYIAEVKSVSNDVTVYIKKYYTIMQGKEINFTIQSKLSPVSLEQSNQLQAVVDSAVYKPIDSSITDSPIFSELTGYFVGFLITVVILGAFIFVMSRSTRKKTY